MKLNLIKYNPLVTTSLPAITG
uniref:Uncharacterized protein n=1 Tax=Moniliophthora roreri TaxID=221103 RepID=A0A0W0G842_MONRR